MTVYTFPFISTVPGIERVSGCTPSRFEYPVSFRVFAAESMIWYVKPSFERVASAASAVMTAPEKPALIGRTV